MKFFGGIILGLVLASAFFLSRPAPVPEKTQKDFQTLTVNEAKSFAEAKTPDEKLKAAEALYGKMMVMFLAHLGLELQKSRPVEIPPEPKREVKPSVAAVSAPESLKEITKTDCAPCAATEKKKEDNKKLTTPDKFRSSSLFTKMDPQVRQMNGVFAGKLSYFAGNRKGKIDSALIEINLRERDGMLDGQIAVILTDENNVTYSRNRGGGGNKIIRHNPADRVVYVEASPNSFFSFRSGQFRLSEVSGDYYEDNVLVGRALLFRQ